MHPTEHKIPGVDGLLPAVDLEHPGFFPYARFSHSTARNRQAEAKPLSQNSQFAVWPNVIGFKAAGTSTTSRRK